MLKKNDKKNSYIKLITIATMVMVPLGVFLISRNSESSPEDPENHIDTPSPIRQETHQLEIPRILSGTDQDEDGIDDLEDIVQGARLDAMNRPTYRSNYYRGGYPPDNEGVCTDVIWRAFSHAGYNLKDMVDEDIKNNVTDYPRVQNRPDPNIDFRRVLNLIPFFKKHATTWTNDLIPNDEENLVQWQGGDIVVFDQPYSHIAIVSDRRREDGVPYIIHNASPYTLEADHLLYWHENLSPIIHHFRFPKVAETTEPRP